MSTFLHLLIYLKFNIKNITFLSWHRPRLCHEMMVSRAFLSSETSPEPSSTLSRLAPHHISTSSQQVASSAVSQRRQKSSDSVNAHYFLWRHQSFVFLWSLLLLPCNEVVLFTFSFCKKLQKQISTYVYSMLMLHKIKQQT